MCRINFWFIFGSIIFLSILIPNVQGAETEADINVSLSWNNGTTYTTALTKTFACGSDDENRLYGNSTYLWGRTWSLNETNDTLFRARMTFVRTSLSGTAYVDNIKIRIYYNLPSPAPIFVSPTPANASTIGSTLRINVTSSTAMSNCWLSYNGTGTWQNISMTNAVNNLSCYRTLSGEDEGIPTGRVFQFQVYANTTGVINQTDIRQVTVSSTMPNLILLNAPANNTYYNFAPTVLLNATMTDLQSDLFDYLFYVNKNKSLVFETPVEYATDMPNGTYVCNISSLPFDRYSNGLKLLYHFDQRSAYGETTTKAFDFSRNNMNATVTSMSINDSGYFGGAYYKYDNNGKINNTINISFPLTISTWVKFDTKPNCLGIGYENVVFGSYGTSTGADKTQNSILIRETATACDTIFMYGNGTIPYEYISVTPSGFNGANWNLYTGVSNATGIYLYLNGNQIGNYSGVYMVIPNGFDIANLRGLTTTTRGLFDEFAVWNRSLTPQEIKELYRLGNGTYYWNASAQDSSTQINSSQIRQFTINPLCWYNSSITSSIPNNVDCEGNDLTFFGGGVIVVTSNIRDWDTLSIISPTLLKIEQGGSIWL
jgi:hypothetical protein